jgi:tetratricopeptide (TPR) repeat protein
LIGRWLNQHRRYGETVRLVTPQEALSSQDLFLVWADALAARNRWKELENVFKTEKVPLEDFLRELFWARICTELGQRELADIHWQRVYLEVDRNPQALMYLGRYAEIQGDSQQAGVAFRRLAREPGFARQAYLALVQLAEKDKNTRALRDILKEIVALFPDDDTPRNDLAYVNLLLNENVTSARGTARELLRKRPDFLAYRITLALADLRLGQPDQAGRLFDGLDVNWPEVLPGWQAVHIAVVAANGRTNLAQALARQVSIGRLKTEETRLIAPFLTASGGVN